MAYTRFMHSAKTSSHQYTWSSEELCFSDFHESSPDDATVSPAASTRSLKSNDVNTVAVRGHPALIDTALDLKVIDEDGTLYIVVSHHDNAHGSEKWVVARAHKLVRR